MFSRFSELPMELQLQVWEESLAGPWMQVFEVRYQAPAENESSNPATTTTTRGNNDSDHDSAALDQAVYFDVVTASIGGGNSETAAVDSSVYKHRHSIRLTSRVAAVAAAAGAGQTGARHAILTNNNTVHLPKRGAAIPYDNDRDVLFLRLGSSSRRRRSTNHNDNENDSAIGAILDAPWTAHFAGTLQVARRIAFDAADLFHAKGGSSNSSGSGRSGDGGGIGGDVVKSAAATASVHGNGRRGAQHVQGSPGSSSPRCAGEDALDAARLASCLQAGLEILYFVRDPRVCDCNCCAGWTSRTSTDGQGRRRELDVIQGVGTTYREVRVKRRHRPRFVRYLDAAIRAQQRDSGAATFKEVRFLVAMDD